MSTLKVDAIRHNSATSDAITTHSDGTASAKIVDVAGGPLSNRNLIINGAMNVAQRSPNVAVNIPGGKTCLLYTSPSPRDNRVSRMPSSA